MRRRPAKRRVPDVLWRLFRDKARTLADTIVSLIPSHSLANCYCKRRRCLRCSGPNAMSFILRPDDPRDYCRLLNCCFVVVNDKAPPLLDFRADSRWSQQQIVERTIEMMMYEGSMSTNVICSGYDKHSHSSPNVECLTCSAWNLLLKRVGDDVMFYILKCASIFLPLPHQKYQQVAGLPISNLCLKFTKRKSESQGPKNKRKRIDDVNSVIKRQQSVVSLESVIKRPEGSSSLSVDDPSSSVTCVGCKGENYFRSHSQHPQKKCGEESSCRAAILTAGGGLAKYEECSNGVENNLNHVTRKFRKRLRQFSWQRRQKCRKLNFQESSDQTCCASVFGDGDSSAEKLACDNNGRLGHLNDKMSKQCSCCSTLQAPHLVSQGDQINRRSMFYSLRSSSSILPRKHVLNTLKPNFSGSKCLIGNIFGLSDVNVSAQSKPCSHSSGFCLIGSACLYHSLLKSLKTLISRTKSCQYLRLLDKHCPVPIVNQQVKETSSSMFQKNELGERIYQQSHDFNTKTCERTVDGGDPQFDAVKFYCSKDQVVSFIWAVCRSIVPSDLLGTPSNWRILRRNIGRFIGLRRFERFSVKQCMHKLKSSRFPFFSNKHSVCYLDELDIKNSSGNNVKVCDELGKLNHAMHNIKHKLWTNWIFWLFSCLIVPLVQSNFYVTESEQGGHEVYYYRKLIWEKLTRRVITGLNDKSYIHVDEDTVRDIVSKRSFGFSKLRLRPKQSGVRMIANLKASSRLPTRESFSNGKFGATDELVQLCNKRVTFDYFKSVNFVLRDTHAVLKGIKLKEPEKLGSSVFDYNDVYRKLCPFLVGLKNGSKKMPGVFIVVSDVSKAFDSIDQEKLLNVMEEVILKDEYHLEQSYQVVCTKRSLWVHENLMSLDRDTSFTRYISSITFRAPHSILINQGKHRLLKKENVLFNLNELVKRNVVQLDRNFYLQGIGIPQGSSLSSLLCSIYYGHLERNLIFPFLEKTYQAANEDLSRRHNFHAAASVQNNREDTMTSCTNYILLRFIDDIIFISTSKEQAASFFSRLGKGFEEYNCYMNEEKFCVNFDIGCKSGLPSNRVFVGEDGISFLRWSGLLINCRTLEVQGDYTRYLSNQLSSALTISWQGKPGNQLKTTLCGFMRPKCHPIFYDSNINSAAVVRLNIYQAFLLCAMKFHCYVSKLSCICRLHPRFYLKIIERSLRYKCLLIKKRIRSLCLGSNPHQILQLEKGEVEWLGLHAYVQVLKKKQSRHSELLSLLRSKLSAHRLAGTLSCQLNYAVDRSHSSQLWKIKF